MLGFACAAPQNVLPLVKRNMVGIGFKMLLCTSSKSCLSIIHVCMYVGMHICMYVFK